MKDPQHMIYLDNAATTYPKPREVFDRMVEQFCRMGVSAGRGSYDAAATAQTTIHRTRCKLARFFDSPDPDRVVFTANATDGLNLAILGLLQSGDHVVATHLEHNSVLRPLHYLQQHRHIRCTLVPFDAQGFIDPNDIDRAIGPDTKLVVVNHASNVLGTIQPVADVGGVCAARGVPLLVDASQSAGQIPVSMTEMQAAAVVFTGHKSLYGPTGIGGLIVHPDLDIATTRFGGTGVHSHSLIHTPSFPHRLEAGTHNLMGIIGLGLAVDYLSEKGLAASYRQIMALTRRLYQALATIDGVTLYATEDLSRRLGVLSINIAGMAPEDVGAILDADFDIAVRVGLHCAPLVHQTLGTGKLGAVRFSIGHFNTEIDIDRAVDAVTRIAKHRDRI